MGKDRNFDAKKGEAALRAALENPPTLRAWLAAHAVMIEDARARGLTWRELATALSVSPPALAQAWRRAQHQRHPPAQFSSQPLGSDPVPRNRITPQEPRPRPPILGPSPEFFDALQKGKNS